MNLATLDEGTGYADLTLYSVTTHSIATISTALLEFIRRLLETKDYQVTSWRTSVRAVEQVARYQPKLVLLAHALGAPPNGWEILQALHVQPTTAHIPVILYSAESRFIRSYGDQVRSMQGDVVEMPFDAEVLLAKIEALTLRSNERGSSE